MVVGKCENYLSGGTLIMLWHGGTLIKVHGQLPLLIEMQVRQKKPSFEANIESLSEEEGSEKKYIVFVAHPIVKQVRLKRLFGKGR